MIRPARCGSNDPTHRSFGCAACKQSYNRATRGPGAERPPCVFCGITRHNSFGVALYQYPLLRTVYLGSGRRTNKVIASIAICDRCLVEQTIPSPSYAKAHGLSERVWPQGTVIREDGLRANDGMPARIAS